MIFSPRRSKYGNQRTIVDGINFDSKAEARYYCELKLLKLAGQIKDYAIKPRFTLLPRNGIFRAVEYIADFLVYYKDGREELIDVKGVETKEFKLKRKMMYSLLGKEIKLIKGGRNGK